MSNYILLAFRWLLYSKIVNLGLDKQYEYFVLTRADELHACIHRSFASMLRECSDCAWVQAGAGYGGYSDRHWAAQTRVFLRLINVTQHITCHPDKFIGVRSLEHLMKEYTRNVRIEVRTFNPSFFTVRAPNDPTRFGMGRDAPAVAALGLKVKYPSELRRVQATCKLAI